MNSNVQAYIVNHDTVTYNADFSVEFLLLANDPARIEEQLQKICDGLINFQSIKTETFFIPSNEEERYERALALVNSIGFAAGRELKEIDYEGNYEDLYRIFCEGVILNNDKKVTGSSIERAFFECGFCSGAIIFSVVDPNIAEKYPSTILDDLFDAFKEGVVSNTHNNLE